MKRDEYGIIIQEGKEDPNWLDAGDSAFSTGIMAFTGSRHDMLLMAHFIVNNQLIRHPRSTVNTGTAPHNDPKATSRDQVLAFFAGLLELDKLNDYDAGLYTGSWLRVRSACLQYARSWRVNSDILNFANKLYLYKCAGVRAPLWLYPLGYLNQALSILWDAYINPDHEMNQSALQNMVFGKWWIKTLYVLHPDLIANITEYFTGWRRKPEIALAFKTKILNSI